MTNLDIPAQLLNLNFSGAAQASQATSTAPPTTAEGIPASTATQASGVSIDQNRVETADAPGAPFPLDELATLRAKVAQFERLEAARELDPVAAQQEVMFVSQEAMEAARSLAARETSPNKKAAVPDFIPGFKASTLDVGEQPSRIFTTDPRMVFLHGLMLWHSLSNIVFLPLFLPSFLAISSSVIPLPA
ncbi:hypothetical protein BD779DRAFT_1189805 [Infundibulicybe gibba]|nr:hypothetical protein BD779DRAFT_1189805 [Infundibulicybe gibba]